MVEIAHVVDAGDQVGLDQVFFGATVSYSDREGELITVTIVGVDEADPLKGHISWISPVAKALIKAREGDEVRLLTPDGPQILLVESVRYDG